MVIEDLGFVQTYKESFSEVLSEMTGMKSLVTGPFDQEISFKLTGVAVIIGITGKYPGRIILGLSPETAEKFASAISDEPIIDEDFMMDIIAEFCNIAAGHTTTKINNKIEGLDLMLTPPSIFSGVDMGIISPKIRSELLKAETGVGEVYISVGFERGT